MFGSKTPVTVLQEHLQKKNQVPNYNLIYNGVGTHDPLFRYEVVVGTNRAVGQGKSKKEAKHQAAKAMVETLLGNRELPPDEVDSNIQSPYEDVMKDNKVGDLTDYCVANNLPVPEYELTRDEGLSHAKIFCYRVRVSSFSEQAEARTKKQAKQLAAGKLLVTLKKYIDTLPPVSPMRTVPKEVVVDELALAKLDELVLTPNKSTGRKEQLGTLISDYHKAFNDPNFPHSETLLSIKGASEDKLRSNENPQDLFVKIMTEIGYGYFLEQLPTLDRGEYAIVLNLETSPSWSFLGMAKSVDDAKTESFYQALVFFATMTL